MLILARLCQRMMQLNTVQLMLIPLKMITFLVIECLSVKYKTLQEQDTHKRALAELTEEDDFI